ncbi:MAG TPA: hypothetical protein VL172_00305 [Kofleriaceae bacterium]|nr:hypothetical protein [Kofleriaceae bacterium]
MQRLFAWTVLGVCLAGCVDDGDGGIGPLDEPPPAESVSQVDGETVFTTQVWVDEDGTRRYRVTGLEHGEPVATLEAVRAPGSDLLPFEGELYLGADGEPLAKHFELQVPLADEKLDGLNDGLAWMYRMTVAATRAAETGLVEQDMPGCDTGAVGGIDSCGGSGHCCDRHDKCYADNGCTSASWNDGIDDACDTCNSNAVSCKAGAIVPGFVIGYLFWSGFWPGAVVGALLSWLFPVFGQPSDCCRLDGICQNSSCNVGWYRWGNHACEMSSINIYCLEQEYYLPNGAGPFYYWQGCYKHDERHQVTYRLAADQVWCVPDDSTGVCSEHYDCPKCPDDLDPTCNPPFFSAGSLMDQVCNQGLPTGVPVDPDEPLPWVPTCAEAGGNTCDNDLADGSLCGPDYDLRQAYDCVHCCCVEGNGDCAPACGDGQCNGDEDCFSCPGDCGQCAECDDRCFGCDMHSGCGRYCGDCPDDVSYTAYITPGGAPIPVNLTAVGANVLVYFNGEEGHRVSLRTSNQTIYAATISIQTPSGAALGNAALSMATGGTFIDVVTLPESGAYRILLDPYGNTTGNLTLTLYDVPPDVTASTSATATGTTSTVSLTTAGQNAVLSFAGSAGQRVSLKTTQTIYAATTSIRKPDGTTVGGPMLSTQSGTGFMDVVTLPVTGTYTILIDGYTYYTGNVTVTLYDVAPDPSGTTSASAAGTASTVGLTIPGQNASLSFAGSAGQRVSVKTTQTIYAAYISIRKPDGSTLTGPILNTQSGTGYLEVVTLPVTGTYTILIDGYTYYTGNVTVTLYDVPPDATASVTPTASGAAVTVGLTGPGQNATVSFSGTSGQRVSLKTTQTLYAAYISIKKPDGTALNSAVLTTQSGTGFVDAVTLPVTGTYTILIDGYTYYTGNVTLTAYNVPPDPAVPIPGWSTPTTVSMGTPGQNATLTFPVNGASQPLTLVLSGVTLYLGYVSVIKPDGQTQIGATSFGTSGRTVSTTLNMAGTYTVKIDAYSYYTGNVTVTIQ